MVMKTRHGMLLSDSYRLRLNHGRFRPDLPLTIYLERSRRLFTRAVRTNSRRRFTMNIGFDALSNGEMRTALKRKSDEVG
jgi:hypothetical protein